MISTVSLALEMRQAVILAGYDQVRRNWPKEAQPTQIEMTACMFDCSADEVAAAIAKGRTTDRIGPLDLLDKTPATTLALSEFERAMRDGDESGEAMARALRTARDAALLHWAGLQKHPG
jgi:hypothetical protein